MADGWGLLRGESEGPAAEGAVYLGVSGKGGLWAGMGAGFVAFWGGGCEQQ